MKLAAFSLIAGLVILCTPAARATGAATNWLETGAASAAVTASGSGDAFANSFDSVTIGSGAAVTYDARAAHGALGVKIATGVTASQASVEWAGTVGTLTTHFGRMYAYVTANPSVNTRLFTAFSGSVLRGSIQLGANGKIRTFDASNSLLASTTASVPLNTWFRIEWKFVGAAGTGEFMLKYFDSADGTTPVTLTSNGADTGGSVDSYRFGTTTNVANLTLFLDDLAISSVTYPGPSGYFRAVVADGPAAYWRLGESSGPSATDSSGSSFSGAYQNTPALGGVGALPHDADLAPTLDGTNDFIEVPDQDLFSRPSGGAISVEAWMRPDSTAMTDDEGSCLTQVPPRPGYVMWLGKGAINQREWGFRMYQDNNCESRQNRISFYAFNQSGPSGNEGNGCYFQEPVSTGQWIHVVGVINQTHVKIYRNGVLRPIVLLNQSLTGGPNVNPQNGTSPLRIGTRDSAGFFKGGIDEVAIYAYELTNAQVVAHYNGR